MLDNRLYASFVIKPKDQDGGSGMPTQARRNAVSGPSKGRQRRVKDIAEELGLQE